MLYHVHYSAHTCSIVMDLLPELIFSLFACPTANFHATSIVTSAEIKPVKVFDHFHDTDIATFLHKYN